MRLTDYENEDALDLLADIMEPAARMMADEEIGKMSRAGKPALVIAPYILRNHKKEAIEIVSAMHREKPGEYRFNAVSLLKDLVDILSDDEVLGLFSSQGQNQGDTSSGSATENTKAKKQ